MTTMNEHDERYLSKELYYGLMDTPVWARELLKANGIKTVADLIELTEDEVREILQSLLYRRGKINRAMRALIEDLKFHHQKLAS